jgi:hypothetical protein
MGRLLSLAVMCALRGSATSADNRALSRCDAKRPRLNLKAIENQWNLDVAGALNALPQGGGMIPLRRFMDGSVYCLRRALPRKETGLSHG